MITEISQKKLFEITKQQIKLKIIKMLDQAVERRFEKIAALRDNDIEFEKYANAYPTLTSIHAAFKKLDRDEDFSTFKSRYMNDKCFVNLITCGVVKRCLSDLQFYLRLLDVDLGDSVVLSPILAKVSQNGLEVKCRLCVDGYCYESNLMSTSDSRSQRSQLTTETTSLQTDTLRRR